MVSKNKMNPKQVRGFSLIELMIAVAIIGILAAVALPNYQSSVERGKRSDATETLMRLAIAQEVFYSQQGTYTTDVSGSTGLKNGTTASTQGYYTITATAGSVGTIADGFILIATAGTQQSGDTECKKFMLDSRNKQSSKNSSGVITTECW